MANSWELMLKAQRMRPHNSYLRYASNDFFIIHNYQSLTPMEAVKIRESKR